MVERLEKRGVDSFWMYEIFQGYEAFSRAGYLAAITKKAKIGAGVVNSYSRHPTITAMGAAFLANVTQGRANLVSEWAAIPGSVECWATTSHTPSNVSKNT